MKDIDALIAAGKTLAQRGWLPATSGNLSVRDPSGGMRITISGRNKGKLTADDLMWVGANGEHSPEQRPSAEAGLHQLIYQTQPETQAVLHVHSPRATVLSMQTSESTLRFQGYELQKALTGIHTHETEVCLPIFPNSQDMKWLAREVKKAKGTTGWGFLIRGHGLYAWGKSVDDALRHTEAFEFLFECRLLEKLNSITLEKRYE